MGRLTPTINIRPLFTSDFALGGYYTFDEWAKELEKMLAESGETDPEGRIARRVYRVLKDFGKHPVKKSYTLFKFPQKGDLGKRGAKHYFCVELWKSEEYMTSTTAEDYEEVYREIEKMKNERLWQRRITPRPTPPPSQGGSGS